MSRPARNPAAWLRPVRLRTFHLLAFAVVLVACSSPQPRSTVSQIDWVDLVQVDEVSYLANAFVASDVLNADDLGAVHATVQFRIAGAVHDHTYRAKDGDATYLAVGTPLHVVAGYAPSTRLAAPVGDGVVIYDADMNPAATTGADLLDLADKVVAISVNSETDGTTELARIEDRSTISELVSMVLAAPVDQSSQATTGERVFVAFQLFDGTRIARSYWLETGELSRGIRLPAAFRATVETALMATTPVG